MIPKIIHYCWFGGKPLPDEVKKYMETWKKYCPYYEITEWNEKAILMLIRINIAGKHMKPGNGLL